MTMLFIILFAMAVLTRSVWPLVAALVLWAVMIWAADS